MMQVWIFLSLLLCVRAPTTKRSKTVTTNDVGLLNPEEEATYYPPPCPSKIYCHGNLLHMIQMSRIYNDSKTFVNMKMKFSPEETLKHFDSFMELTNNAPSRDDILRFVEDDFDPAGSELEIWQPSDWKETPPFLKKIADPNLREWGKSLNLLWKRLGRKMSYKVKNNPELYSIIYVPHPFIVQGKGSTEFNYWDNYWIVEGLLISGMKNTAKGIILNCIHLIEEYGYVPSGNRIYFQRRSQPPMLTPMVDLYYKATNDLEFVQTCIFVLEREFRFWLENRTVTLVRDGVSYSMVHYKEMSSGPRPDHYREDVEYANKFEAEDRESFYTEVKAAEESGWGTSSRWYVPPIHGKSGINSSRLETTHILPVDLNAIFYWNAIILSNLFQKMGNNSKATLYDSLAADLLKSVTDVLWHDDVKSWLDYDALTKRRRNTFYPSNLVPLWVGCYTEEKKPKITKFLVHYLDQLDIMGHRGGIPTSQVTTGFLWDMPYSHAPMQYYVIKALDALKENEPSIMAYNFAEKWLRRKYHAFKNSTRKNKMDLQLVGKTHVIPIKMAPSVKYAWTNSIAITLMEKYGGQLSSGGAEIALQVTALGGILVVIWKV